MSRHGFLAFSLTLLFTQDQFRVSKFHQKTGIEWHEDGQNSRQLGAACCARALTLTSIYGLALRLFPVASEHLTLDTCPQRKLK